MGFDSHKFRNNIENYRLNLSKLITNFSIDQIKKFDMLQDFSLPEGENEIIN